ncbi:MAG: archaeosortase/exosortase family protein [Bacteroidales bacterium]|nr:archaeosortase/exosortase family protein [Bacteroidales bacterium]
MFSDKIKLKLVSKFLINAAILVAAWFVFYKLVRNVWFVDYLYEEGIYWLTRIQIIFSKFFLNIIGYTVEVYGKTIKIVGSYGVHVDRGCLGRNTLGLFVGFILAFPGKFKNKIWFLAMGIVIFIFLNVMRILGLAITDNCCREQLDFNHHFLFKIIVYVVIFFLWAWWIKKYSAIAEKNKSTNL